MNSADSKAIEINEKIHQLPLVKTFRALEAFIIEETNFIDEEQSLFAIQKELVQGMYQGVDKQNLQTEYIRRKEALENNPIYVNYRVQLEEVNRLIQMIADMLKASL